MWTESKSKILTNDCGSVVVIDFNYLYLLFMNTFVANVSSVVSTRTVAANINAGFSKTTLCNKV